MPFSEKVVHKAWNRAGGKCECHRKIHGHRYVRCAAQLVMSNRGMGGIDAWEAYHKIDGKGDNLSNCEILCWDCYIRILTQEHKRVQYPKNVEEMITNDR